MSQLTNREELANVMEEEFEDWAARERVAAYRSFQETTGIAWKEYELIWKPARERWEAFSGPFLAELTSKLISIGRELSLKLEEARSNWDTCPRCGASTNRFQVFCSKEKCEINLLTWKGEGNATSAGMSDRTTE